MKIMHQKSRPSQLICVAISAQDPNPLDPQDFGYLYSDPRDFGFLDSDPRGKISTKNYSQTPNLKCSKNKDFKKFLISEWFIKFQYKNKRKKRRKII